MDITPSGLLPRALQAQLSLPPPPAGVVPPPWPAGALEALVVAVRPAATPSGGWNLELDIGGERVQMSSATLLAAGTRVLLRALSPERVRAEQLPDGAQAPQPLRSALRSDLPAQLPLREAIAGIATLAADPALPEPLRARIVELLAQLPDPARLQQAAGLRAAVLNSGSFLEPRLRAMLGAAAGEALPAAAARQASAAATPPATDAAAAPAGAAARPASAPPAHGPRVALAALLRLLVPARQVAASADSAAPASPTTAPPSVAGARPIPPPLYDAQGALRAGPDGAAAPAAGTPPGSTALAATPAAPSGVASPPAANHADALAPPPATPGLSPAPATPGAASPAAAAQPVPTGASPGATAMATAVSSPSGAGTGNAAPPRPGAATAAGAQLPTGGSDAPARAAASTGIAADLKGRLFVLLEAVSASLGARADAGRTLPSGSGVPAPGQPLYTAHGLFAGESASAQSAAVTLPAAEQLVARLARQLAGAEPARGRDHPGELVETLLRYVVGALARTRVHQLGVHPENRRQGDGGAVQAWSVEIPIAYGARLDALEMRIEDHGRREEGPRGGAERVWQVLMSVELEQIGPLHALLRLSGTRLATTLWVENPAALASARDTLAELGDCLRAEGVDVTRLECLPGAPPPRARSSHDNLLDVST